MKMITKQVFDCIINKGNLNIFEWKTSMIIRQ